MADLCFMSIDAVAPRLKSGELSPVELTRAFLDRIHADLRAMLVAAPGELPERHAQPVLELHRAHGAQPHSLRELSLHRCEPAIEGLDGGDSVSGKGVVSGKTASSKDGKSDDAKNK